MAMQALRENAKKGLKIGMIAGDGIGRIVLPVSLATRPQMDPARCSSGWYHLLLSLGERLW